MALVEKSWETAVGWLREAVSKHTGRHFRDNHPVPVTIPASSSDAQPAKLPKAPVLMPFMTTITFLHARLAEREGSGSQLVQMEDGQETRQRMANDKLSVSELATTALVALPPVVPLAELAETLRSCRFQTFPISPDVNAALCSGKKAAKPLCVVCSTRAHNSKNAEAAR